MRWFNRAIAVIMLLFGAHTAAALTYQAVDLGAIGDTPSGYFTYGINSTGMVVGARDTVGVKRAFLHDGSTMSYPGTLGTVTSEAYGINDSGSIVGYAANSDNTANRAFVYSGTDLNDLGTLGGKNSTAYGINNNGSVVGEAQISPDSNVSQAFLYTPGVSGLKNLGTIGTAPSSTRSSTAYGINESGQVAGVSDIDGGANYHAFLYDVNGSMNDLGTLGGYNSSAYAINDSGSVVGFSEVDTGSSAYHAFLYKDGTMVDIQTLDDAVISNAFSINDSGGIVGFYSKGYADILSASGYWDIHAFFYENGEMKDLTTMLLDPGISLLNAMGINDYGQIAAYGFNTAGQLRAFRLDPVTAPVPEPATLILLGTGFVGLLSAHRKQRR